MKEVSSDALLALLNSAPVVRGEVRDELTAPGASRELLALFGAADDDAARHRMRAVRDALQAVGHGQASADALAEFLVDVDRRPVVADDVLGWELDGPVDALPAARAVVAWFETTKALPGRLRPCGNPECTKFLLDRSKPNTGKWCSMAECGNRLKARRHTARRGR